MTDWRAAGLRADAHRVTKLLRGQFSNPEKERVRRRVVRFLVARQPELVLDAWGGGSSADDFVAAGLPVLSVDDGRAFAAHGISKPRGFRAMEIAGQEGGYQTARGGLDRHAHQADAAFLDFMGHWCRAHERTIFACRHMKALVVTLMPERTDLGSLSQQMWEVAYRALLEAASGMRLVWIARYTRESGLPALVFALERGAYQIDQRSCLCGCGQLIAGRRKKFATEACAARYAYAQRGREKAVAMSDEERAALNAHRREVRRARIANMPAAKREALLERHRNYYRDYYAKNKDRINARLRDKYGLERPTLTCSICAGDFVPGRRTKGAWASECSTRCRTRAQYLKHHAARRMAARTYVAAKKLDPAWVEKVREQQRESSARYRAKNKDRMSASARIGRIGTKQQVAA